MNDCVATAPTPASIHGTRGPTLNQCDCTATPSSPVAGSRATIEKVWTGRRGAGVSPCASAAVGHATVANTHATARLRNSLVRDLQSAIDDVEGFTQLLLRDDQRRVGEEVVPSHEGEESLLTEELAERRHFRRRAVERRHRLLRLAVASQFDHAEQTDGAYGADRRVTLRQIRHQLRHHLACPLRAVNQVVLFVDPDGRERRGTGERMATVGETAGKHLV